MSVTDDTNKCLFDCSAITTYDFTFKILKDTDLQVYLVDKLTYEETLLTLNTDYTITKSRIGDGGTIELATAHPGYSCLVERYLDIIQPEEIPTEGYFPEVTIENAFDRLTMICQQLQEQVGRSPKVESYTQFSNLTIETPVDGKTLVYSVDGDKVTIKCSEYNLDDIVEEMREVAEEANENLTKVLNAITYVQSVYDNMLFYELLGTANITIDNNAGYLFFEKQGSTTVTVDEKATMLFSEKYNDDEVTIVIDSSTEEVNISDEE